MWLWILMNLNKSASYLLPPVKFNVKFQNCIWILNSILHDAQLCYKTRRYLEDNSEMTRTLKLHLTLHVSHTSDFIPHTETITSQISFRNVWLIWAETVKESRLQYYITPALVSTLLCMFETNKGAINTLMNWQLNKLTHMHKSSIKISSLF